ncbi:hypothetical protein PMI08_02155 [Brevibacillus sp. CF112]|uniref:hypothetical protein n=1 Tax=Brevibacillus agri TaxID=51101 RepID=UPI000271BB92|nr:hypothetical protein [Brevibacillus agri]EJL44037.1 hypothetical protein PMI08_02155 [Brevibacillus sp. CF112]
MVVDPKERMHNWFILHKTVDFLKKDLDCSKDAPLRLPFALTESIRLIGSTAYAAERASAKELKITGIRLLKEFYDQREYFVVWSYRGETHLLRLHENAVRIQVQKRVQEFIEKIFSRREKMSLD